MGITLLDVLLIPVSVVYIATIILISTKLRRSGRISGIVSRKLVHVGVGVIVILVPLLYSSRIVPTMIGLSFIFINYLTSPASPISKFKLSAIEEGHDFGTVYYSIALTLLFYFYFDSGWIIQVGFLPLVIGDAAANLVGIKYGSHKWIYFSEKSLEGSFAAFISTFIILIFALEFYVIIDEFSKPFDIIIYIAVLAALATTIAELISPYGLDNLSIPLVCTGIALLF
ncbi:MAG: diacylglycerol/polyprenol kinase family protein [Candidatus Kariarchaeaceae archaeon]